jgi:hypothetical protein
MIRIDTFSRPVSGRKVKGKVFHALNSTSQKDSITAYKTSSQQPHKAFEIFIYRGVLVSTPQQAIVFCSTPICSLYRYRLQINMGLKKITA